MTKKDKDIAFFHRILYRRYGAVKGVSGEQVLHLFPLYGVMRFLAATFGAIMCMASMAQNRDVNAIDVHSHLRCNQADFA